MDWKSLALLVLWINEPGIRAVLTVFFLKCTLALFHRSPERKSNIPKASEEGRSLGCNARQPVFGALLLDSATERTEKDTLPMISFYY